MGPARPLPFGPEETHPRCALSPRSTEKQPCDPCIKPLTIGWRAVRLAARVPGPKRPARPWRKSREGIMRHTPALVLSCLATLGAACLPAGISAAAADGAHARPNVLF